MGCSKCGRPSIIFQDYSGLDLCEQHFKEDILHKAKRTVRQNHWLVPGRRYAVALSGGLSSYALLDFMHNLVGGRKDIGLVAITIKKNYDPGALENAKEITEAYDIPWFSILEDPSDTKMEEGCKSSATNQSPFFRHRSIENMLATVAEQLEIDALALGYTLEDHAEWVLWNAISGTVIQKSGNSKGSRKSVRIIRPFMHIPRQELNLFTRLFLDRFDEGGPVAGNDPGWDQVSQAVVRFCSRHPGATYALVNIGEQIKKFRNQGLS